MSVTHSVDKKPCKAKPSYELKLNMFLFSFSFVFVFGEEGAGKEVEDAVEEALEACAASGVVDAGLSRR